MFTLFVLLGMAWFHLGEYYSILDSIYYVVVILTTVGYGLDNQNDAEHMTFLSFYILYALVIIATFLSIILIDILESYKKNRVHAKKREFSMV